MAVAMRTPTPYRASRPAAPNMPAPMPAFFALPLISSWASRNSSRTSWETSLDSRETSSPVEITAHGRRR